MNNHGEMAEWFKAHAWNACIGATLSWVRIPLSPPKNSSLKVVIKKYVNFFFFIKLALNININSANLYG